MRVWLSLYLTSFPFFKEFPNKALYLLYCSSPPEIISIRQDDGCERPSHGGEDGERENRLYSKCFCFSPPHFIQITCKPPMESCICNKSKFVQYFEDIYLMWSSPVFKVSNISCFLIFVHGHHILWYSSASTWNNIVIILEQTRLYRIFFLFNLRTVLSNLNPIVNLIPFSYAI